MEDFDFEDLSEAELDEILIYSESEDNLETRYVVACQIIANMVEDLEFESFSNPDMVDMTICKMLIDGHIEIEHEKRILHWLNDCSNPTYPLALTKSPPYEQIWSSKAIYTV